MCVIEFTRRDGIARNNFMSSNGISELLVTLNGSLYQIENLYARNRSELRFEGFFLTEKVENIIIYTCVYMWF